MRSFYKHLSLLVVVFLAIANLLQAQEQHEGIPASKEFRLNNSHIPLEVITPDSETAALGEQLKGVDNPGEPLHAGFALPAPIDARKQGVWEVVNGNLHVWRLRIKSPGALGLGINFNAFSLNEGSRLFVYDPEQQIILGAFDHRNNNKYQIFSTHIIPGEELIIEYQEPFYEGKKMVMENTLFNIESLIYINQGGDMDMFSEKDLGDSDDCQVNINCQEGDNWQNQKRGVARMLMKVGTGYSWCTGTLINNTAQDMTPFFLTAEHCGRNASAEDQLYWQFYFNFERPDCNNEGTPAYDMIVGCMPKSVGPLDGGSDFRLVELIKTPPPHYRPYWNGWDRSTNISNAGAGIHHPAGDAKKISTYNVMLESANPLVSGQQMADNSAWQVRWAPTQNGHGVSEGGSSGSPLFNSDKLVIGTLTGGSSSCDNPYFPDYYGKFSYHWDQNGFQANQMLQVYLDPWETGQLTLEGLDPYVSAEPAPGYIEANVNGNQVDIQWYQPGSFPNAEGWYRYVNTYSHLTWTGPQRAVLFKAELLGLSYPLTLSAISHVFVQQGDPWPDDRFTFSVYAGNGIDLLYESPILTAESMEDIEHQLSEPIVINEDFYVSVNPLSSTGHPSSLMLVTNYGEGHSFNGSPGNWVPYSNSPSNGMWTSYTYLTSIFVEGEQQSAKYILSPFEGENYEIPDQALEIKSQAQPESYKLYRDNDLIFTSPDAQVTSYQETINSAGLYSYYVTAVYNGEESLPSNIAYVLIPEPCDQVIDQWPYQQVFNSDFDPSCWITTTDQQAEWQLTDSHMWEENTVEPFEGDQFYVIDPAEDENVESWLITPEIDFSQLEDPALRFYFNGAFIQGENDLLNSISVMVSTGGNSFVNLWDSRYYPSVNQQQNEVALSWKPTTVDLSEFGNTTNVRIAFRFLGSDRAFAAIDNINIISADGIRHTVNVNVVEDDTGIVRGAGQYLEGETVTLVAVPNVAQAFEEWRQGSNVLSQDEVYSFIMPGNNITLTASFIINPVNVDEEVVSDNTPVVAFPNPTQGNINLRFGQTLSHATLVLMNAQGQVVEQLSLDNIYPGQEKSIKMEHLPEGIYFLSVRSDIQQQLIKVVLTK